MRDDVHSRHPAEETMHTRFHKKMGPWQRRSAWLSLRGEGGLNEEKDKALAIDDLLLFWGCGGRYSFLCFRGRNRHNPENNKNSKSEGFFGCFSYLYAITWWRLGFFVVELLGSFPFSFLAFFGGFIGCTGGLVVYVAEANSSRRTPSTRVCQSIDSLVKARDSLTRSLSLACQQPGTRQRKCPWLWREG